MSFVVLTLEVLLNVIIVPFMQAYIRDWFQQEITVWTNLLLAEVITELERDYSKRIYINLNWG